MESLENVSICFRHYEIVNTLISNLNNINKFLEMNKSLPD
jgi:hypothetical protein